MPAALPHPSSCSLTLVTPPLSAATAPAFARVFAEVLAVAPIASARVRLASGAEGEAKAIVIPLLSAAVSADPRRAARLGADGAHVEGAGEALDEALESLKPERIVGVGALRMRDDAMSAGEKGADYVMFGEPHGAVPPMALELLLERVGWWAEIFETPCIAYAESIEAARRLAAAGADFVAVDDAIWGAPSPADAARALHAALSGAAAEAS
jgi:thiamine-phosphate pyrophosphorylase